MLGMRRLRTSENMRKMVRENSWSLSDLIYPFFVEENISEKVEIKSMPGIYRISERDIADEINELFELGIRYVMPFGVSHHKDSIGNDCMIEEGLLYRIIKKIKNVCPEMIVIPDVCFCEYTSHGHCGVLTKDGVVNNQATIENLAKQSIVAARAGADILAPSAMMDFQIKEIRKALDQEGFDHVAILAHAVKYASSFYGPFRSAAGCDLQGDRKTYQMDYANSNEAMREAKLDEMEGADFLMVKPGTPYLDVVQRLKQQTLLPIASYQVSGEYSAIKFASKAGALNEKDVVFESIMGFKRAGASLIVTYFAKQIAIWLKE